MFATAPVDVAPLECELKPYTTVLYADAEKKRPVSLPKGALIRKCPGTGEMSYVLTKPDSGGTDMCVIYDHGVDAKTPDVQITRQRMGVAKALPDKTCPPLDHRRQAYPGKDWFYLGNNVALPNAFKVKQKVEKDGLAFLNAEKKSRPDRAAVDYGTSQLNLLSVAEARTPECRKNATAFETRYAACYRAEFYNQTVRGGWSFLVALTTKGEYQIVESARAAK